jgi:hypothetical protein
VSKNLPIEKVRGMDSKGVQPPSLRRREKATTEFLMARKFTSTAQKRLKDLAETTLSLPEPLQLRQILLTGNDWILLAN